MYKRELQQILEMKKYLVDLDNYVEEFKITEYDDLQNKDEYRIKTFRYIAGQIVSNILALDKKLENKILPEYLADCRKVGSYSISDFRIIKEFINEDLKECIEYINKVNKKMV